MTCRHHLPDWWSLAGVRLDGRPHRFLHAVAMVHVFLLHPGGWLPGVLFPHRALRRELEQARRDIIRLTFRLSALAVVTGCPDREALLDFPDNGEMDDQPPWRRIEQSALSQLPGGAS